MGLDANAKPAGNSDLLRELHDQERAVSAKHLDSGSSTTGRDVHKKRVGQTRDTRQSHGWNTGESCRVEENTFMSTDHKAVFLETDMSKEGKEHTNKTSIKRWKPSPQWVKKREDLKMDWTRWQDTVEEIKSQHQQWEMWTLHAKQRNIRSYKTCWRHKKH